MKPFFTSLLILLCVEPRLAAQVYRSGEVSFQLETLLTGIAHPWSLALIDSENGSPPQEGFVSLRSGVLYFLTDIPLPGGGGRAVHRPVTGLPDLFVHGQGGLLDVILAANFKVNSRIYFSAAKPDTGGKSGTAVYVAHFNRRRLRLENTTLLFSLKHTSRSNIHFGSRLTLGPGGDLFVSVGERGDAPRAQDRADAAGSIIRIPLNAAGLARGEAENYSFGHRNIQGLVYDAATDQLLAHEHGPRGGDEINLISPDANYGWPLVSYGVNYNGSRVSPHQSLAGIMEPLIYWVPSIAPSGFALYPESGVFAPRRGRGWSGQLFVGALAGQHLRRVALPPEWRDASWPLNDRAEQEEVLRIGRVRDVRIDEPGYIYFLTDEPAATLYRLIPAHQ